LLKVQAFEIHHNICEVYGQNIISDGMVHKWEKAFKDGRKNVYDKERSGRPSMISDNLLQKVKMNQRFTISSLSEEFP
jgi:hypothetical protein